MSRLPRRLPESGAGKAPYALYAWCNRLREAVASLEPGVPHNLQQVRGPNGLLIEGLFAAKRESVRDFSFTVKWTFPNGITAENWSDFSGFHPFQPEVTAEVLANCTAVSGQEYDQGRADSRGYVRYWPDTPNVIRLPRAVGAGWVLDVVFEQGDGSPLPVYSPNSNPPGGEHGGYLLPMMCQYPATDVSDLGKFLIDRQLVPGPVYLAYDAPGTQNHGIGSTQRKNFKGMRIVGAGSPQNSYLGLGLTGGIAARDFNDSGFFETVFYPGISFTVMGTVRPADGLELAGALT